jgi:hypothetical protein
MLSSDHTVPAQRRARFAVRFHAERRSAAPVQAVYGSSATAFCRHTPVRPTEGRSSALAVALDDRLSTCARSPVARKDGLARSTVSSVVEHCDVEIGDSLLVGDDLDAGNLRSFDRGGKHDEHIGAKGDGTYRSVDECGLSNKLS